MDMLFSLSPGGDHGDSKDQTYMQRWKRGMTDAYEITRENAKAAVWSKRHCDGKMRYSTLLPSDRGLVRSLTPRGGPGKLRNHWEDVLHIVVCQVSKDSPVYELKPEKGEGRSRTLHRNLLLPCDHLPLETFLQPQSKNRSTADSAETPQVHSKEDDDEEDEYYPVPRHLSTGPDPPESQGSTKSACQDNHSDEVLQVTEPDVAEADQPPEDDGRGEPSFPPFASFSCLQ